MIQLDHLAVEARDVAASARFLADILGLAGPVPEGEDDDMFRIDLDHGVFVLFSPASEPRFSHVAFRVDAARFESIVDRLRARGVAFGNDHDDTRNHRTEDFLGGAGRVYFHDADGHLWEVTC
ncbi:VOC family protein [Nannocystis sp. RBIL2]|uniref:VOC family protein n=1 Tax=Nannocystis sp. RBIL2 TaxID=2996788 RepID=UPI002271AB5A|nr:VOC family protein [Nannocystis sp. RBIL2]MCY1063818.1 VOC family protein [Nannocystis sp. RBIL2]